MRSTDRGEGSAVARALTTTRNYGGPEKLTKDDRLAPNFDFLRAGKTSAALGFAWNSSKNYQFRKLCGVSVTFQFSRSGVALSGYSSI